MLCLQVFLPTLFVYFISATDFCSKSESEVDCQPCSVICPGTEKCEFRCPKQCGPNKPDQCRPVCAWQCQNNRCEFDNNGALKCSDGCRDGLTGKYCQERCRTGCSICQQFSTDCVECDEGLKGKDCSIKEEKNVTVYTTSDYEELDHTVDNLPCQEPACGTTAFRHTTQSSVNDEATAAAVLSGTVEVIPLVIGISAVLILIAIVILVYVKLSKRKDGKSETDGTSSTEHRTGAYYTYDYIDDVSLVSYYSSLHGQRKANFEDIEHQEGTRVVMSKEYEDHLPQSV